MSMSLGGVGRGASTCLLTLREVLQDQRVGLTPFELLLELGLKAHEILHAVAGTLSAAESYPTCEVRDSGPECQAVTAQERLRGATLRLRSVAVAERSYPASEVSGGSWEEQPMPEARASGQEEQPEEWWLCRHRRA